MGCSRANVSAVSAALLCVVGGGHAWDRGRWLSSSSSCTSLMPATRWILVLATLRRTRCCGFAGNQPGRRVALCPWYSQLTARRRWAHLVHSARTSQSSCRLPLLLQLAAPAAIGSLLVFSMGEMPLLVTCPERVWLAVGHKEIRFVHDAAIGLVIMVRGL